MVLVVRGYGKVLVERGYCEVVRGYYEVVLRFTRVFNVLRVMR